MSTQTPIRFDSAYARNPSRASADGISAVPHSPSDTSRATQSVNSDAADQPRDGAELPVELIQIRAMLKPGAYPRTAFGTCSPGIMEAGARHGAEADGNDPLPGGRLHEDS